MNYDKQLKAAIEAAREAGEILLQEFHRPDGPRGEHLHAEADEVAERAIRKKLLAAFPQYRYRGEETGMVETSDPHIWLVDPNDGTGAYLRGSRGSSVSIGLLRNGLPVLGVVYAFAAPDDRGDLICWCEGGELTRNGKAIKTNWRANRPDHTIVLVTTHRESLIEPLLRILSPYRYRTFPSVAYRLALAAAGEGAVAVSWHSPGDWDYAAGHALIRGAGGVLVNEKGEEVTYATDGYSKTEKCFGGDPDLAQELCKRDWSPIEKWRFSAPAISGTPFLLTRLKPGKTIKDPDLLSRAQGCLLGQITGDALGAQFEFMNAASIQPEETTRMNDGRPWETLAGQPTDDSELALLLARTIVHEGSYDRNKVAEAYLHWYHDTQPFDIGSTIQHSLSSVVPQNLHKESAAMLEKNALETSQANGSLMRISPLAIYGWQMPSRELWQLACEESRLTHPNLVCQHACALFTSAIAHAIKTGEAADKIYEKTVQLAIDKAVDVSLLHALKQASNSKPDYNQFPGWALVAFQNAFYELAHFRDFETSLIETARQGEDADTNCAVTGALLGAVAGRDAIPHQWQRMVLTCRAHVLANASHPRPFWLWAVDALTIAEQLLIFGQQGAPVLTGIGIRGL